ncbi:uncharacterized protein LOC117109244 [Anneissia japonica]|uniref:uncharacterized protein LOC117109244 n=1 Tax=Anneissia japonica TaxID=1529436 RepID=UPI001425866A|nr:uncharacterized protein LOC117109244 [Anneissia japonica]
MEDAFDSKDEYDVQDDTGIWDQFGSDDEANYSFAADSSMEDTGEDFEDGVSIAAGMENKTNFQDGTGTSYDANHMTDDMVEDPAAGYSEDEATVAIDNGLDYEAQRAALSLHSSMETAYYVDGPSTDPETVDDLGLFQRPYGYITENFNKEPEVITLKRGSVYSTLSPFYKQNHSIRQAFIKFDNETGVGFGPKKEALRLFHEEEKDMLYEGYTEMIPRTYGESSNVLGRALYDTFKFTGGFPLFISKPFIFKLLTGKNIKTYDEECLIKSYINFSSMSNDDKLILLSAVNNGVQSMSSENKTKFFEAISREKDIKIAQNIGPDYFNQCVDETNWRQVVTDLACLDIIEKPACVSVAQEFQLCMGECEFYSVNEAKDFINKMNPKPQSIIDMIETPLELTDDMKKVIGYLYRFIISRCDNPKMAEQFLIYFTASTNLPLTKIRIDFHVEVVTACTCADMIQLPTTYESYKDFENEMITLINDDFSTFTCI